MDFRTPPALVGALGPRTLRALWFRALAATVYRRLLLYERELGDPPERPSELSVTAELLNEADIGDYLAFRADAERFEIVARLEAGELCFALWFEGRIVHACWAAPRVAQIEYLGCLLPLRADEVYVYDSFTDTKVRFLGLSRVRAAWMERFLRAAGYQRWLCTALPENAAGRRFIEDRAGSRLLGTIGSVRIGRWRRGFTRPNGGSLPRPLVNRDGAPRSTGTR
jgi:hypothetical protein